MRYLRAVLSRLAKEMEPHDSTPGFAVYSASECRGRGLLSDRAKGRFARCVVLKMRTQDNEVKRGLASRRTRSLASGAVVMGQVRPARDTSRGSWIDA